MQRRDITPKQLAERLAPDEFKIFQRLVESENDKGGKGGKGGKGVPLVKVVVDPGDTWGPSSPGLFQFKHLSFQEALAAIWVVERKGVDREGQTWRSWADDETAAKFVQQSQSNNMCKIGGSRLGRALGKLRPHWELRSKCVPPTKQSHTALHDPFAASSLAFLLRNNSEVQSIDLDGCTLPIKQLSGVPTDKPTDTLTFEWPPPDLAARLGTGESYDGFFEAPEIGRDKPEGQDYIRQVGAGFHKDFGIGPQSGQEWRYVRLRGAFSKASMRVVAALAATNHSLKHLHIRLDYDRLLQDVQSYGREAWSSPISLLRQIIQAEKPGLLTGAVLFTTIMKNSSLESLSLCGTDLVEMLTLEDSEVKYQNGEDCAGFVEVEASKWTGPDFGVASQAAIPLSAVRNPLAKAKLAKAAGGTGNTPGVQVLYRFQPTDALKARVAREEAKDETKNVGKRSLRQWRDKFHADRTTPHIEVASYGGSLGVVAQPRTGKHVYIYDHSGLMMLLKATMASRSLTDLDLASNNLGDLGAMAVAEVLGGSALVRVGLADNKIGREGVTAFAILIHATTSTGESGRKGTQSLQAINLLRNAFSSSTASLLADAAATWPAPGLSLCGILGKPSAGRQGTPQTEMRDTLGRSDIVLLTADLKIRPHLTVVDTSGSAEPDDEGVERLAAAISRATNIATFNGINLKDQREGKLTRLALPKGKQGSATISRTEASVLAGLVPLNAALRVVDARGSCIDGKVAELLAAAILANTGVTRCEPVDMAALRANKLDALTVPQAAKEDEAVGQVELLVIAGLLPEATGLRTLDISSVAAGDAALGAMGNALLRTPSSELRFLRCEAFSLDQQVVGRHMMSSSGLGPGATTLLASLLKHIGAECTELHISNNQFGDVGAKALASGLQQLPKMRRLFAHSCGIDVEGGAALRAALRFDVYLLYSSQMNAVETIIKGDLEEREKEEQIVAALDGVPRYCTSDDTAAAARLEDGVSPLQVPVMVGNGSAAHLWRNTPLTQLTMAGGRGERAGRPMPANGLAAIASMVDARIYLLGSDVGEVDDDGNGAMLPPGYLAQFPLTPASLASVLGEPRLPRIADDAKQFSAQARGKRAAAAKQLDEGGGGASAKGSKVKRELEAARQQASAGGAGGAGGEAAAEPPPPKLPNLTAELTEKFFSAEARGRRGEVARGLEKGAIGRSRTRRGLEAALETDKDASAAGAGAGAGAGGGGGGGGAKAAPMDPSSPIGKLEAELAAKMGRWLLPAEGESATRNVEPDGWQTAWPAAAKAGGEAARAAVTLYVTSCPACASVRSAGEALATLLLALRVPHEIVDVASLPMAARRRLAAASQLLRVPCLRIGGAVLSLEQLRMSLDCDKDDKGKPIDGAEGGARQLIVKAHASPSAAVAAAAPATAAAPAAAAPSGNVETQKHYHVLGVQKSDPPDAIRKAYRELAIKHHPDKNEAEIQEAFDILGNEQKRKAYDLLADLPAATVGFMHGDERGPVVHRAAGPKLSDLYWAGFRGGIDGFVHAFSREVAPLFSGPLVTWELRLRRATSDAAAGLPGHARGLYDPLAMEHYRVFTLRTEQYVFRDRRGGQADSPWGKDDTMQAYQAYYGDPEAKKGPILASPLTNLGAYARLVPGPTARSDRLVGFYGDVPYQNLGGATGQEVELSPRGSEGGDQSDDEVSIPVKLKS